MAGRGREVVGGGDEGRMRERGSVEDTEGREFVYINVFAYLYESGYLYGMNALMYFYIYIYTVYI